MERKHGNVFNILPSVFLLAVFKFLEKRLALLVELCLKLAQVLFLRISYVIFDDLNSSNRFFP